MHSTTSLQPFLGFDWTQLALPFGDGTEGRDAVTSDAARRRPQAGADADVKLPSGSRARPQTGGGTSHQQCESQPMLAQRQARRS